MALVGAGLPAAESLLPSTGDISCCWVPSLFFLSFLAQFSMSSIVWGSGRLRVSGSRNVSRPLPMASPPNSSPGSHGRMRAYSSVTNTRRLTGPHRMHEMGTIVTDVPVAWASATRAGRSKTAEQSVVVGTQWMLNGSCDPPWREGKGDSMWPYK